MRGGASQKSVLTVKVYLLLAEIDLSGICTSTPYADLATVAFPVIAKNKATFYELVKNPQKAAHYGRKGINRRSNVN